MAVCDGAGHTLGQPWRQSKPHPVLHMPFWRSAPGHPAYRPDASPACSTREWHHTTTSISELALLMSQGERTQQHGSNYTDTQSATAIRVPGMVIQLTLRQSNETPWKCGYVLELPEVIPAELTERCMVVTGREEVGPQQNERACQPGSQWRCKQGCRAVRQDDHVSDSSWKRQACTSQSSPASSQDLISMFPPEAANKCFCRLSSLTLLQAHQVEMDTLGA